VLRRILALLASGGARTLEGFALELDLDPAEVEDMLERLCSLDYVEELGEAMSGSCVDGERSSRAGCSGCGMASLCGQARKGRVWSLTSKGREAARSGTDIPAEPPEGSSLR
jgi:hypothetical protein